MNYVFSLVRRNSDVSTIFRCRFSYGAEGIGMILIRGIRYLEKLTFLVFELVTVSCVVTCAETIRKT